MVEVTKIEDINALVEQERRRDPKGFEQHIKFIEGQLRNLKRMNPTLSQQDLDDICALATEYEPDDPKMILKAYYRFLALKNRHR